MLDKLYITPRQWLRILRWALYAVLFVTVMMVQTVVLGNRTVFGIHPDLVPIVITCVCLREGAERGGLFALLASLFWCLSGTDSGSICILVLTVLPVLGCLLCSALFTNRYLSCLLFSFLTLACEQILIFTVKYFLDGIAGELFLQQLVPCVLVSILTQPLLYWLVKCIGKIGASYESA